MSQPPKIHLADVCKSFGPKKILTGVNLDVAQGESIVIIGGSGTGKSVLLKCIIGLMLADSGTIEVDGTDVTKIAANDRDETNEKFGMLFQGGALFDSLPVWENVAFGLIQGRHLSRADAKEHALESLTKVGLSEDVGALSPAELSGGMQKRVGLARAIASSPEIVFFDEPTTGLDPIMADVINDLILTCVNYQGITAITFTRDLASGRKLADRIAMLYHGKLIWVGPAADVDNSGNDYVDQFVHGRAEGPIQMELRR